MPEQKLKICIPLLLLASGCETLRTLPIGPVPQYSTQVVTYPSGLRVSLDGAFVGTTPTTLQWKGYELRGRRMIFDADHRHTISINYPGASDDGPRLLMFTGPCCGQNFHGHPPRYENLPKEISVDWEHPPAPIDLSKFDAAVPELKSPAPITMRLPPRYAITELYYNDSTWQW